MLQKLGIDGFQFNVNNTHDSNFLIFRSSV